MEVLSKCCKELNLNYMTFSFLIHKLCEYLAAIFSEQYSTIPVLFKTLDNGLPADLSTSPALVRRICGAVYIPVVNKVDKCIVISL